MGSWLEAAVGQFPEGQGLTGGVGPHGLEGGQRGWQRVDTAQTDTCAHSDTNLHHSWPRTPRHQPGIGTEALASHSPCPHGEH
jgi:hypothetical protein